MGGNAREGNADCIVTTKSFEAQDIGSERGMGEVAQIFVDESYVSTRTTTTPTFQE